MGKAPLIPRRKPRTPSGTERAISMILSVVLVVAVGLFALSGTRPGPPTLPESEAAPPAAGPFPLTSPGGWPRGDVEVYDIDTLFEKINGKADAYVAYGFESLSFASWTDPARPDVFVDVYLYDMGTPLDAFGVFRAQHGGTTPSADLGAEGAASGASRFARQGRHYLEIVGSGPDAVEELDRIATGVIEGLEAAPSPILVPPGLDGQGVRTIRFDRKDALGVAILTNAFVALHADGAQVVVATYPSAAAAEAAAVEARDTLELFGDPVVFETHGARLIGVAGVAEADRQESLLAPLRPPSGEEEEER